MERERQKGRGGRGRERDWPYKSCSIGNKSSLEVLKAMFITGNQLAIVAWGNSFQQPWGLGQSHSRDSLHNKQPELLPFRPEQPAAPGNSLLSWTYHIWDKFESSSSSYCSTWLSIADWARPFWKCPTLKLVLVDNRRFPRFDALFSSPWYEAMMKEIYKEILLNSIENFV